MPAPAGRSVHSTGLPSAGQLAQRSRLPLMRRFNSRLILGAGANNAAVACNQRTAMAPRHADGIAIGADGGDAPSLPAACPEISRFAPFSKPNTRPPSARRGAAGSTPIAHLALMDATGAPLLTNY